MSFGPRRAQTFNFVAMSINGRVNVIEGRAGGNHRSCMARQATPMRSMWSCSSPMPTSSYEPVSDPGYSRMMAASGLSSHAPVTLGPGRRLLLVRSGGLFCDLYARRRHADFCMEFRLAQ